LVPLVNRDLGEVRVEREQATAVIEDHGVAGVIKILGQHDEPGT
jgi:hypothetical protein